MPHTVVFLWISGTTQAHALDRAHRPTAAETSALQDFARARRLAIVPAETDRPQGLPANDAALVERIEAELERARTALVTLEEGAAAGPLQQARMQLLSHPYLPQAGFLFAECLALQARAARETNPDAADLLERQRLALEGPRADAFGDPHAAPGATASVALALTGLAANDELELDAGPPERAPAALKLQVGFHHARVWRDGQPIFASFFEVTTQQTRLELAVRPLVACSAEDLAVVTEAAEPPRSIACPHWAKVRPELGGVGVALCERDSCQPFVHWQPRSPVPFTPIALERTSMPSWAAFALAGVTVAAATGLVLWQSGAFDRGESKSWQFSGIERGAPPPGMRF